MDSPVKASNYWPFGEMCGYYKCSHRYTYCGSPSQEEREEHKRIFHPNPVPTMIERTINSIDKIDLDKLEIILEKLELIEKRVKRFGETIKEHKQ